MYEKILVPVDGSENCYSALREAIRIAKLTDGKITVVHVYVRHSPALLEDKEAWLEDLKDAAKTVLDDAKKIASVEGFEVETLLLDGDAVHEIVKTVDDQHFDLIVMGAKGKSNLSKIFLGSVSSGVLKNASRPVLITKCLKKSNSKNKPT